MGQDGTQAQMLNMTRLVFLQPDGNNSGKATMMKITLFLDALCNFILSVKCSNDFVIFVICWNPSVFYTWNTKTEWPQSITWSITYQMR